VRDEAAELGYDAAQQRKVRAPADVGRGRHQDLTLKPMNAGMNKSYITLPSRCNAGHTVRTGTMPKGDLSYTMEYSMKYTM
jgi:hypothetical protein